jgi:hypothetical protein
MNPDVVAAVDDLVRKGVLEARAATSLRRAASGSLVSLRDELRALLWVGVFLITAGVGILVRQNLDRIGPLAVAIILGVTALGCLSWAWRHASAPGFVFDSALLLGALLAAADLAFIEVKFTPLGSHWPWHLLIVAAAYAALAFRFDSKSLFSLSLTSFAAWRGVSLAYVASPWGAVAESDRLLIEALICGVLFLALGKLLESSQIKAQFEPVAEWLGWILIVGALVMRLGVDEGRPIVATALTGCGFVLAWFAWDERSIARYALGIGTIAVGIGGWGVEAIDRVGGGENAFLALVVLLAGAVIVLLLRAQRALRGPA